MLLFASHAEDRKKLLLLLSCMVLQSLTLLPSIFGRPYQHPVPLSILQLLACCAASSDPPPGADSHWEYINREVLCDFDTSTYLFRAQLVRNILRRQSPANHVGLWWVLLTALPPLQLLRIFYDPQCVFMLPVAMRRSSSVRHPRR